LRLAIIESKAPRGSSATPPAQFPTSLSELQPQDAAAPVASDIGATRFQLSIVGAIFIAYAALSYYSDTVPGRSGLATGLSLAPVLLIGAVLLWRWTGPLIALSILALVCGLLYQYWAFLKGNYQWSNLAQQCGAYGLVALGFVRSLFGARVPLCTQIAVRLHGPLGPAEATYTRRATVAWAAFYVLLTLAIAIVYFAAPPRVWSLFVNFATFGLIGLMFATEHAVRLKVLPHRRGGGTLAALRQFLGG
jgi:uncharacterized membrane protein